MSEKICVIPEWWGAAEAQKHTCEDGSHYHVEAGKAFEAVLKGKAKWRTLGGMTCLVERHEALEIYYSEIARLRKMCSRRSGSHAASQ